MNLGIFSNPPVILPGAPSLTASYPNNATNPVCGHIDIARKFSCDSCWELLLQAIMWRGLTKASICSDVRSHLWLTNLSLLSLFRSAAARLLFLLSMSFLLQYFSSLLISIISPLFFFLLPFICLPYHLILFMALNSHHHKQLLVQFTAYWCMWLKTQCLCVWSLFDFSSTVFWSQPTVLRRVHYVDVFICPLMLSLPWHRNKSERWGWFLYWHRCTQMYAKDTQTGKKTCTHIHHFILIFWYSAAILAH